MSGIVMAGSRNRQRTGMNDPSFLSSSNPLEPTDAQAEAELFVDSILPRAGVLKVFAAEAGQERFAIRSPAYIVDADVVQAERGRRLESDEYRVVDLERLELEAAEYDVVLCINVLEHVHKPIALFPIVARGLKHDGLFVLMLPNVLSLKGMVTRVTPSRLGQWFYVRVLRTPRQTDPVSSVHSLSLRASSLRRHAASNDLNVEYVRLYEGAAQRAVRSRVGLVGWRWRLVAALTRLMTLDC
jgi:SAM-dependent methyltransferase